MKANAAGSVTPYPSNKYPNDKQYPVAPVSSSHKTTESSCPVRPPSANQPPPTAGLFPFTSKGLPPKHINGPVHIAATGNAPLGHAHPPGYAHSVRTATYPVRASMQNYHHAAVTGGGDYGCLSPPPPKRNLYTSIAATANSAVAVDKQAKRASATPSPPTSSASLAPASASASAKNATTSVRLNVATTTTSTSSSNKPTESVPDRPPTPTSVLLDPYKSFVGKPTSAAGKSSRQIKASTKPAASGKAVKALSGKGKGRQTAASTGGKGKRGKPGKGGRGRPLTSDSCDSDDAVATATSGQPPAQKRRVRNSRAILSSASSESSDASTSTATASAAPLVGEKVPLTASRRRRVASTKRRVSFAGKHGQLLDISTDDDDEDDDSSGFRVQRRGAQMGAGSKPLAAGGGKGVARSSDNDSDDTRDIKRRSTRVAINASKLDKNAMMLMAEEEGRLERIRIQKIRGYQLSYCFHVAFPLRRFNF